MGIFGPSKMELKFINDFNQHELNGWLKMAEDELIKHGYQLSEPKYDVITNWVVGIITVYTRDDRAIGEILYSCYTEGIESIDKRIIYRNEKKYGKYYHAIHLGDGMEGIGYVSTRLREKPPSWLMICADIYSQYIGIQGFKIDYTDYMKRYFYSSGCERYLNVMFCATTKSLTKAQQGDAKAQYDLAWEYKENNEMEKYAEWILKCVNNPNIPNPKPQWYLKAVYQLGNLYQFGYAPAILPINIDTALHWFEKANKLGYEVDPFHMGFTYKSLNKIIKAKEWFKKAAEQNNAPSQLFLGFIYFDEAYNKEKEIFDISLLKISLDWFEKSKDGLDEIDKIGALKQIASIKDIIKEDEKIKELDLHCKITEHNEVSRLKNVERKELVDVVKIMLADREPVEKIIKYTGFTRDEIERLQ